MLLRQHRTRWEGLAAILASFALARVFASDLTLLSFLLPIGLLMHSVRQHRRCRQLLDQQRQLTALLPLCPNCGQLLCHDGQWRSFEQLLQNPPLPGSLPHHPCVPSPSSPEGSADSRE